MQLSKNFSLEELTFSRVALRLGLDNTPEDDQIESLRSLALSVLQPLRDNSGIITVNSGYRSPEVNKADHGAPNSQHMRGQAADIESPQQTNHALASFIKNNLEFDELILECYTPGVPDSGWVHVSYHQGQNRGNILTAFRKNGTMEYERGLLK